KKMKNKIYFILCVVVVGVFFTVSCSSKEGEVVDPLPTKPDEVTDEKIELGFNYTGTDRRPLLACGSYTPQQMEALNDALIEKISKAKTKRGKTVVAAAFLAGLDYCIPYAYEW